MGNEAGALGYRHVDDGSSTDVLVSAMDETGQWDSTRRLRAWEQEQLALTPGERLLDVGCGPGDAGLALAADLGETGELVGVDTSEQMLRVARARARSARCRVRFTRGSATALDEPDDAFDAARSERTLQWLSDPAVAVAELVRVVRPGGRISLIDTDWSTFGITVGDEPIEAAIQEAMRTERNRASNVGRRLGDLVVAARCQPLGELEATQHWTDWDPDRSPAPLGCFTMESLADDLVDAGHLRGADRESIVSTIHAAARRGEFSMSLTMFAVVATAP